MNKHKLILSLALLGASSQALAHGLMEYPKARQEFCTEQGGYWWPDDGSAIPNAACRAAFLASGTVQFVQNHEFSINVADFRNMDAVKAAIPDGKLCAAADHAKRGMDVVSRDWQRTAMTVDADGTVELLFAAHTPHNPSFWQFYLSTPDYDAATEALSWGKLELIAELGDQPISLIGDKKYYRMRIAIPAGRSGEATLYTRWQRDDAAGEGFYNCSDIVLDQGGSVPDWQTLGAFVPPGLDVEPGDELWFRVFDGVGAEKVFEKRTVAEAELEDGIWAKNLAAQVGTATSLVAIGVKVQDGSISYSDVLGDNKVWTREAGLSYRLDLKSSPPAVTINGLKVSYTLQNANVEVAYELNASKPVAVTLLLEKDSALVSEESLQLAQGSLARSLALTEVGSYRLILQNLETGGKESRDFNVIAADDCSVSDPDALNHPAWAAATIYNSGDKVSFNSLVWRANWWSQGSEPSASNGAWSLVSQVLLPWDPAIAYAQGKQATFNGKLWQASWWTQGEAPGSGSAWQAMGPWQCGQ